MKLQNKEISTKIISQDDQEFIQIIMGLSKEKKTLLRGLVAGLALQEEQFDSNVTIKSS